MEKTITNLSLHDLERRNAELESAVCYMKKEIDMLHSKLNLFIGNKKNKHMEISATSSKNSSDILKTKGYINSCFFDELIEKTTELTAKEICNPELKINDLKNACQKLKMKMKLLKNDNINLQNKNVELERNVHRLESELQQKMSKVPEQMKTDIIDIHRSFEVKPILVYVRFNGISIRPRSEKKSVPPQTNQTKIHELNNRIAQLENEKNVSVAKKHKLKKKIIFLKSQIDSLNNSLEIKDKEKLELKIICERTAKKLSKQQNKQSLIIKKYENFIPQNQLDAIVDENKQLVKQLNLAKIRMNQIISLNKSLEKNLILSKNRNIELEGKLKESENNKSELQSCINSIKLNNDQLQSEIDILRSTIHAENPEEDENCDFSCISCVPEDIQEKILPIIYNESFDHKMRIKLVMKKITSEYNQKLNRFEEESHSLTNMLQNIKKELDSFISQVSLATIGESLDVETLIRFPDSGESIIRRIESSIKPFTYF